MFLCRGCKLRRKNLVAFIALQCSTGFGCRLDWGIFSEAWQIFADPCRIWLIFEAEGSLILILSLAEDAPRPGPFLGDEAKLVFRYEAE